MYAFGTVLEGADPLDEVQDLGGADRVEAAGRVREWVLERP
jgi:hypothetical protein